MPAIRSSFALALGLVAMTFAAAAAPAEARTTHLTGYDTIAPTGARTTLRFKVETKFLFISIHAHGVRVEFRAGGTLLGTAVSADEGYADLTVNAGASAGDVIVT